MSVRPHTLKVATHNVNGLAAKVQSLTTLWRHLRFDIVVAVDTHVDFFARPSVQRALQVAGWTSFWCSSLPSASGGRTSAGIAILLRSILVLSGVLAVAGDISTPSSGPAQGRLLMLPLTWAGQRLDVIGVYLHPSSHFSNTAIISGPLADMKQHAHSNLLVLGDFNFVLDATLDRRRVSALSVQQTHDTAPAISWAHQFGTGLHDAWRMLHPHRRAFTYVRPDIASRIDRIYIVSALLPQVVACTIADREPAVSDHWPVQVQLTPAHAGALGPGLQRLKLSFQSDISCRHQLRDCLTL